MRIPMQAILNTATRAGRALVAQAPEIAAQCVGAAITAHGAKPDAAPAATPQPSMRNAMARNLHQKWAERSSSGAPAQQKQDQEAFERANQTVKDAAGLG